MISIVLLNIILFLLFSIPSVQKYAADFALGKLKPIIGTEASIDGIRIKLFNTVHLEGVYLEDQQQDTLLYAGGISARVNVWNLLNNQLSIESVRLENFTVNVHKETPDAPFSFQFLPDAFKSDKPKKETTGSPLQIEINDLRLKNGTLRLNVLSEPETPGVLNTNHLYVRGLNLEASLKSIDIKNLIADIKTFGFEEVHAGIVVDDLQATARSKDTRFWSDRVRLKLNNSDISVTEALYDTSSKEFAITAKSDTIDPRDAALFSTDLASLNKPVSFQIKAEGQLPEITLHHLIASYGSQTSVDVEGEISDYNELDNSDIDVNVKQLFLSPDDLQAFLRIGSPEFVMPEQLPALGNIDLRLKAQGKLNRFRYDGLIRTEQGNIVLSGLGKADKDFKNIAFEGPVSANNIQLANILGEGAPVDDLTLRTDVKFAMSGDQAFDIQANGNVVSILYKDYRYNDVFFDGAYNGKSITAHIHTDTEQNRLNIFADMAFQGEKVFDVNGTIDRLDLRPFFLVEGWTNPSLTTRIEGRLAGNSFDDMVGTVMIDSTSLVDSSFIYNPGPIYLQALADEGEGKKLQIYTSVFEGEITGDYHFSTIGNEFMHALHPHLPSMIKEPNGQKADIGKNVFQFNLQLKNMEDVAYTFSLPFYNVEPATITGSVDMVTDESVQLNAYIPRLMFGNNDIRETKIDVTNGPLSGVGVTANTYLVQESGYVNARLNTSVVSDSVMNRLFFDVQNNVAKSNGELQIGLGFQRDPQDQLVSNIHIYPTTVLFNSQHIDFNESTITYGKDRIEIRNFGMQEKGMLLLGIDGVASKSAKDNVRIYFNNTELANFLAAFNIQQFKGSINGAITIHQALQNPMIQTDGLRIENITAYNDTIGTLQIQGNWDNINLGLDLNAYLAHQGKRSLEIVGFIPTDDKSPQKMNVRLGIQDFPLVSVLPLASSVFSELSGNLNSSINVTGSTSEPVIEGWLGVDEGLMKIAYTNVTYRISDTIRIDRNTIGLNNLVIRDNNNQTATLNVSLSHTNFGGMVYNVSFRMNDFMLLNNNNRTDQIAYGLLKLSGQINITGSSMGIYGDANLTNESRSNVTVVIPQTASAAQYSGVIYINTPEAADSLTFLRRRDQDGQGQSINTRSSSGIPINMRAIVNLTSLLQTKVVLNPTTNDALDVTGTGELNVSYNSRSTPSIGVFGDYVIDKGKFNYNLQGLRTIEFNIREGSTLTMVGDPMNTQFNITAYHQVKADLATLSSSFSTDLSNTRVPVNALLEIKGNLDRMDLQYGIELPEASNDVQQRMNSLISTEEARIRQFGALVVTGNFYSSGGTSDFNIGSEFTSLAAGALSSGLDMLFANALRDNWTVSTNLETQNGTFDNLRMGVDVSTRLLDDRLRVTTNLSYGDNSMMASQQAFMGEFEAEYDINNWLMIRGYNRANEQFFRRAPTTQGVGVVVTKEGRSLRDLFRFRSRKKEEEK